MPETIRLPSGDPSPARGAGSGQARLESYTLRERVTWPTPDGPFRSRVAYAAAHVVVDPAASSLGRLPLGQWKLGLLMNFNVPVLTRGIRRFIL